ncbi:LamG-like jellyroll fold domain-containing protein [Nitrosospira sp. NpAV]|uniref:LamG-like jellyroll fold domain-containing protein n=1 Tax=Nitrosospira sp. NpAV TaxID=58133 RepID=UPI0005A12149|nr:LamG-like jellyroll fold domain-containing protein [Nitrosospira sp. NpAV]KIO48184.1 hypothetical protein SQ11_13580 [Nitrosospira sp. NpAV]
MAIGFGAAKGAASTDKITGPTEGIGAGFSFHVWTNRNGEGAGSLGRIFAREGTLPFVLCNNNDATNYRFFIGPGAATNWLWGRPSAGVWTPIGISADTSSSANDPIIYQAGARLTVGSGLTQSGSNSSWPTGSNTWYFGNNPDGTRNWDGSLAEVAWWNAILTDEEFFALQKGISPDQIRPEALQHYLPMVRSGAIDKLGAPAAVTGTAAQDHPRMILRHHRNIGAFTVVVGGWNLTGSGSAQTNTTNVPAIAQAHVLAGAASTQGNSGSVDAIVSGAVHDLAGVASIQANTSGAAAIGQAHASGISASMQNNASTAMAITQIHALACMDSTETNSCGAGAISIGGDFVGAPSTQANQSGTGQIARTQMLSGANPAQTNLSGSGTISDGIMVEAALRASLARTMRMKKPGIPAGTPEWLKTLLEIIIGRRGNAIEIPRFQTLTFSATPTKAECEALYAYTNEVRRSVENILARLDG